MQIKKVLDAFRRRFQKKAASLENGASPPAPPPDQAPEGSTCATSGAAELPVSQSPVSENNNIPSGFGGTKTTAKGENLNEDACQYYGCEHTQVLVLADGLGSSSGSGLAARAAVQGVMQAMQSCPSTVPLRDLFAVAATAVREEYRRENGTDAHNNNSWLTTLLIVRDTPETIEIGWVGNGGVWHARGSVLDAWHETEDLEILAAAWIPLLLPHSTRQDGQKALTRTLGPQHSDSPSLLTLDKDATEGDLILAVTDGIASWEAMPRVPSRDEYAEGDERFHLWTGGHERLLFVQERIATYLNDPLWSKQPSQAAAAQTLNEAITRCLSDLHRERMLLDDASVGVLVSAAACHRLLSRLKTVQDKD